MWNLTDLAIASTPPGNACCGGQSRAGKTLCAVCGRRWRIRHRTFPPYRRRTRSPSGGTAERQLCRSCWPPRRSDFPLRPPSHGFSVRARIASNYGMPRTSIPGKHSAGKPFACSSIASTSRTAEVVEAYWLTNFPYSQGGPSGSVPHGQEPLGDREPRVSMTPRTVTASSTSAIIMPTAC